MSRVFEGYFLQQLDFFDGVGLRGERMKGLRTWGQLVIQSLKRHSWTALIDNVVVVLFMFVG